MAHLKAHIRVLFSINSIIRKCNIALKATLLVPPLKWKSSEVQNRYNCNSYPPKPLIEGLQESLPALLVSFTNCLLTSKLLQH